MPPIIPNYNWENGVKKIKITDKKNVTKLYLVSIAKDKDPSIRIKMQQTFFFIFPTISHISAEWCDLFNMFFLNVLNGLMASFDILCSNTLNLKNKNTKIEHKKIFCDPSKTLENISWPVNICLKYFVTSTKTLRQPPAPPPPKKSASIKW